MLFFLANKDFIPKTSKELEKKVKDQKGYFEAKHSK